MRHIRKLAAALFCFATFSIQGAFASEDTAHGVEATAHGDAIAHGDDGHAAAAEHSSAGLPQLDASTFPSQVFWLAITFVILYLYFSKKTLPEISSIIENRRDHVQGDLDTAEDVRREAQDAQDTYEKLVENARVETTKILNDATGEVKAQGEKKLAALRDKNISDMAALETRLAQEKQKAMSDMTAIAAEIATQAAEKIVGIKPDLKQAQTVVQALNGREAA